MVCHFLTIIVILCHFCSLKSYPLDCEPCLVRCFTNGPQFKNEKALKNALYNREFLYLDNAIPIKSWFADPSDTALLNILPMLDALRFTADVRSILSRNVHNYSTCMVISSYNLPFLISPIIFT